MHLNIVHIQKHNILFSSLAHSHITFGDGEEFTKDEINLWLWLYKKHSFPIKWKVGDIAVLCNYRWAHGRPSTHLKEDEYREMGIFLGDFFDRVGQKDFRYYI